MTKVRFFDIAQDVLNKNEVLYRVEFFEDDTGAPEHFATTAGYEAIKDFVCEEYELDEDSVDEQVEIEEA